MSLKHKVTLRDGQKVTADLINETINTAVEFCQRIQADYNFTVCHKKISKKACLF